MRPDHVSTARLPARGLITALAALSALAFAASLEAQVVRGSVRTDDGSAVEGAIVRLIAADSQHVAMLLTDRNGHFLLVAPRPGTYQLEAEHVLYTTHRTAPFTIPHSATTTRHITLTPTRRGQSREPRGEDCERPCAAAALRAPTRSAKDRVG